MKKCLALVATTLLLPISGWSADVSPPLNENFCVIDTVHENADFESLSGGNLAVISLDPSLEDEPDQINGNFQLSGIKAYVINHNDNTLAVIDIASNESSSPINLPGDPNGLAIAPNHLIAAATCNNYDNDGILTFIETTTDTVLQNVQILSDPGCLTFSPDSAWVLLTHRSHNVVSMVQTSPPYNVVVVPVGTAPSAIAISPDGTRAFVTNQDSISVIHLDLENYVYSLESAGNGPHTLVIKQFIPPATPSAPPSPPLDSLVPPAPPTPPTPPPPPPPPPPSILTPLCIKGIQKANVFEDHTEYSNIVKWCESISKEIIGYDIYRNGILVGTQPANQRWFVDQNRSPDEHDLYIITAKDTWGQQSLPVTVILP